MSNFIARVWRKRDTQEFIARLREAGYHVSGDRYKYTCYHEGELVFSALSGRTSYLCRINKAFVTDTSEVPVTV